jgi:hypothetical protein
VRAARRRGATLAGCVEPRSAVLLTRSSVAAWVQLCFVA